MQQPRRDVERAGICQGRAAWYARTRTESTRAGDVTVTALLFMQLVVAFFSCDVFFFFFPFGRSHDQHFSQGLKNEQISNFKKGEEDILWSGVPSADVFTLGSIARQA